jgi:predicted lipoprotein
MWHYCEFDAAAASLTRAVEAHVAAAGDAMLEPARAAWREAMLVWARAELFQFGPAGSRAHDPYYGASFRDRIYAWPSVSRCRVEEQLVSQSYRDDFNGVLVSSKGLFALEYLLFYPGSDTACAASSATRAAWDALSPTELDQRKRDYALALARNVSSLVSELRAAWDPSAGNFRQTFIDAVGYDKPGSDSDQEALNIVAWSLVYGEKEVKDYKIGPFTGKMLPPAPVDGFEAPFAGLSQEIVVANLEGLRSAYQGCGPQGEGIGFDDWLVAANHAELALSLDTTLAAAIGATRAFPSFEAASQAELASLYDTGVKPFTDLLKNELLAGNGSVLNLSLPASAAADND